jgi:hypothetical protein
MSGSAMAGFGTGCVKSRIIDSRVDNYSYKVVDLTWNVGFRMKFHSKILDFVENYFITF